MGQLPVEHLELRHGQQPGQRPHQPHQLSGQLLHHGQRHLRPHAGHGGREQEWSFPDRYRGQREEVTNGIVGPEAILFDVTMKKVCCHIFI